MQKTKKNKRVKDKSVYEKPLFEEMREFNFPVEIINSLGHKISCNQCSACHGCA